MKEFDKWWEPELPKYSMFMCDAESWARLAWQAATERAAKIAEKECCDGCANPFYEHGLKSGWARQLAAKIRQDQD